MNEEAEVECLFYISKQMFNSRPMWVFWIMHELTYFINCEGNVWSRKGKIL